MVSRWANRRIGFCIAMAMCLAVGNLAQGFPQPAFPLETLELQVSDSDVVVVGRITNVRDLDRDSDGVQRYIASVDVTETIKGPARRRVSFISWGWLQRAPDECLICLPYESLALPDTGEAPGLRSTTLTERHVFGKDWRLGIDSAFVLFKLSSLLAAGVLTMDRQYLTNREQIISRAREVAAFPGHRPPVQVSVNLLPGEPVIPEMSQWEGGPMLVPLDDYTHAVARRWAVSPEARFRFYAAQILPHFDATDLDRDLMGRLLTDAYYTVARVGPAAVRIYPVRQKAWVGKNPKAASPPRIYESLAAYRSPDWMTIGVWALAVVIACLLLSWHRRRCRRAGRAVIPATSVVAFTLAICIGTLWNASARRTDELVVTRGSRHRIASYRGAVQYMFVADWPERNSILAASFGHDTSTDEAWEWNQRDFGHIIWSWVLVLNRVPNKQHAFAGLMSVEGTVSDTLGNPHPYYSVRVPYGWIMAALVIIALLPTHSVMRRRRRARRGLCAACGYDLRESPICCPECGLKTASLRLKNNLLTAP